MTMFIITKSVTGGFFSLTLLDVVSGGRVDTSKLGSDIATRHIYLSCRWVIIKFSFIVYFHKELHITYIYCLHVQY